MPKPKTFTYQIKFSYCKDTATPNTGVLGNAVWFLLGFVLLERKETITSLFICHYIGMRIHNIITLSSEMYSCLGCAIFEVIQIPRADKHFCTNLTVDFLLLPRYVEPTWGINFIEIQWFHTLHGICFLKQKCLASYQQFYIYFANAFLVFLGCILSPG